MQVFWIFIQTSQVSSNFVGGLCLHYLNSVDRYLSCMLVLSAIGILMFLPLTSAEGEAGINNQSLMSNTAEQSELPSTHIRAGSHCAEVMKLPLRAATYEASKFHLEKTEEKLKPSFSSVLPFITNLASLL
eukprot:TRINITY_DN10712_c0_g4_i1.p2 TRINITY_DN10712_c0_g4~~TRINITY_DN10712_c0_g4_i1.p2  ORF type:complete len:131 (-),score=16.78 TRINITY_DN10712_c0_g4_i1:756-1148(-)